MQRNALYATEYLPHLKKKHEFVNSVGVGRKYVIDRNFLNEKYYI